MSHILPPTDHSARDMFVLEDLIAVATGKTPVHCNRHALRRQAKKAFEKAPIAKRMIYFYVRGDTDTLQLVSIGRRGGFKVEWSFGPITRETILL